jgi:PAS domain S-box-containing protein
LGFSILTEISPSNLICKEYSPLSSQYENQASVVISHQRLEILTKNLPGGVLIETPQRQVMLANPIFCNIFSIPVPPEELLGIDCRQAAQQVKHLFVDSEGFINGIEEIIKRSEPVRGEELLMVDGRVLERDYTPIEDGAGNFEHFWYYRDVTNSLQSRRLLTLQSKILEKIAFDTSLNEILEAICLSLEQITPGILCSILLYNPKENILQPGVAPNFPEEYAQAFLKLTVGEAEGSCGTAAYRKEAVFVCDIEHSILWEKYREIALKHHIKACWSIPFMAKNGDLLGTVAISRRMTGEPSQFQIEMLNTAAYLAGIAVEKHQTAEALNRSETLYRVVFEQAGEGIAISNIKGQYVLVSPSFCKMTGYTESELLKMNIRDLVPPETEVQLFPKVVKKIPGTREVELLRKDGTRFFAEICGYPVMLNGENFVLGIVRDISERRKAEFAFMESEQRMRALINATPDTICFKDGFGYWLIANQAHLELFGLKDVDYQGKTDSELAQFAHPHYQNMLLSSEVKDEQIWKAATATHIEEKYIDPRGNERIFKVTKIPLFEQDGSRKGLLTIGRDVTDERKREQQIRSHLQQTQQLQQTIEKLNLAKNIDQILKISGSSLRKLLKVDRYAILLYNEQEQFEFVDWFRLSKAYRTAVNGHCPWKKEDLAAKPVAVSDVDNSDLLTADLKKIIAAEGIKSLVFVPLKGTNQLLGKFMLYYNSPHHFTEEEIQLSMVIAQNISAVIIRQQMMLKSQRAEARYSSIINNAAEAIYQISESGDFLMVNPAFVKMLGYPDADYILKNVNAKDIYWDPEERQRLNTVVKKFGIIENIEVRLKRKDGSPIWVMMNDHAVKDEEDNLIYFEGMLLDITERKKAEQNLQESEARYRTLVEHAPMAIAVHQNGRLIYVNDAGLRLVGANSKEDVIGKSVFEFVHPDYREEVKKRMQAVYATQENLPTIEEKFICIDGTVIDVEVSVRQVLLNGQPAAQLIVKDVTDRKIAEQALLESEQTNRLMAALIEQATESVMVTDTDGRIVYVNKAFEKLTGYTMAEVFHKNPKFLNSGHQSKEFYQHMWKTITSGNTWKGKFVNKRKDGTLFSEAAIIFPVKNDEGKHINLCKIGRDITHEIQLEEQLRQAQKMETIGTLAGGIAHDFNNILAPIMGYTDMVLDTLSPDDPLYSDLQEVLKGAQRGKELVEQILLFSKRTEKILKPVFVQSIVREALKLLRPSIPSTIVIETIIDEQTPAVMADAVQIHQVIVNLCTNAYQAMEARSGKITIQLKKATDALPAVVPAGEYVYLAIADNGIGMDKKTLKRIFEPFFTTKPVDKGTGLGLSVVHGIVKSHDGHIEVESEFGKGTTIHIYLPAVNEPQTETTHLDSSRLNKKYKGTILIVDDNEIVLKMLQQMLQRLGYSPVIYSDSKAALKALQNDPQQFDLVITDLTMPQLSGLELADQIQKLHHSPPVVIMTGYGDNLNEENRIKFGVQRVMPKPIMMNELAELLNDVFATLT